MKQQRRFDLLFVIVPSCVLAVGYFIFVGPTSALISIGTSTIVVTAGLVLARNVGRNAVYGTTAADAATPNPVGDALGHDQYGSPRDVNNRRRVQGVGTPGAPTTRLVTDRELASMATTSFAPPAGISPWQGHVLLHEIIDRRTVDALIAQLIAAEALQIDGMSSPSVASAGVASPQPSSDAQCLTRGPRYPRATPFERDVVDQLLGADGRVGFGAFDTDYAVAVSNVRRALKRSINESGWWRRWHTPPLANRNWTANDKSGAAFTKVVGVLGAFALMAIVAVALAIRLPEVVAVVLATAATMSCAFAAMLLRRWPERTGDGSAYALQVESFRRFLDASEDTYVEHAWDHQMIREYTPWAIAISEADAWRSEVARAETVRFGDLATVIALDRAHPELGLLRQPGATTRARLYRWATRLRVTERSPFDPPTPQSPDSERR